MFRKLVRPVLAVMAALAVSACSYGSMVDIAPMKSRIAKPVMAAGDYCEVQGTTAPFTIVSHEDCVPITWDQGTRTYTMHDLEDPSENIEAAVVSLGSSLYAGQISTPEDKIPHQIQVFISKGDAFAILSALSDKELKQLSAKHARVTFADDSTGRPYIAAGRIDHIKTFLKDAGRQSLLLMKQKDDTLSVGVLDRQGLPDHPASERQRKDIEAVLKAAKALTPKQP